MDIKVIVGSILRHVLTMLGAYLVGKGYIEPDAAAGLVEMAAGGLVAIGTVIYSVWRTYQLKSQAK